ncbi:clustered mitochondria-domain-containing protein [Melampsora americana]|nr:clustered mitochondria-domain-containing protein [Melampsora americana]
MSLDSSLVLVQPSPSMPSAETLPENQDLSSGSATEQNDGQAANAPDEEEPKMFELSIFIPRPTFCGKINFPSHAAAEGASTESSYLEITLTTQGSETIRDLQQSVMESTEGWWLGTFGLTTVQLDQNGQPDPKSNTSAKRTILGEFAELSTAFADEKYQDPTLKRALEAINIDYNDYFARLHVIRVRDVLYNQAPGLLMGNTTPFVTYDPTQIGLSGGISAFPSIRGVDPESDENRNGLIEPSVTESAVVSAKNKKKKGSEIGQSSFPPESESHSSSISDLADYKFSPTKPFEAFDVIREEFEKCSNHPPGRYVKTFTLSNWNPPPHPLRLRGHHLYLTLTTLESETIQLTCHTKGFYINKCTKSQFDPFPRTSDPPSSKAPFYHSLFHLICSVSPLFASRLSETWNRALSPSLPDFFSSIPITNCPPAYPWLVNPPKHTADGLRPQLAFLLTGSVTAECLPLARDWADEFAQVRELPRKTLPERTLRERLWNRLQFDFTMAATRSVIACNAGDVPALNPHEPETAWTFVQNNMLISRAADPIAAYDHLGGAVAARAIASKDLANIKHLNELDIPGVYTMGSAVVDYHGKRWIVQGMIPGIFRPPDFEAETAKLLAAIDSTPKADTPKKSEPAVETNGQDGKQDTHVDDEPEWEDVEESDAAGKTAKDTDANFTIPPPTTYEILYGSVDIEKPEMGLRSDPQFHKLAAKVASGFNLVEHKVTDLTGQAHQLWLSADIHGIKATDGRYYLIDLYRMTPLDVLFLENDFKGPILNEAPPTAATVESSDSAVIQVTPEYPHRFTLIRPEAVSAFKTYKFRVFALDQLAKRQKEASETPTDTADDETKKSKTKANGPILEEDFNFGLNPDACVDRKSQPWETSVDKDEEQIATVKELSKFVRQQLVPSVVQELCEVKGLPADGKRVSDLLHSHGVNIRYLGHVAHQLESSANDLSVATDHKDDQLVVLKANIGMLRSEMVFRACKHILNRLLEQISQAETSHCISHFLNCLLGTSPAIPHEADGFDSDAQWMTYTQEGLQAEIVQEVRRRYRYALPMSFFTERLSATKTQMLRELCTRMGIQLALKDYQLSAPVVQAIPPPAPVHSTDEEEASADSTPIAEGTVQSSNKNKKKKKSKSKKSATNMSTDNSITSQTFSPMDVLNILPIVRDSTCRSTVADELYAEGRKAFNAGHIGLGQELCNDALTTYEQVFGSVHPEMCRHWHSLAIIYHQLYQRALMELTEYNERLEELKIRCLGATNETERESLKAEIQDAYKERDVEGMKVEIENYVQLAAQNLRQSVIVAERTLGLDHPETIQQYSDLSVMEYTLGNTKTAMRYTKHALDLWHLIYGPGCHPNGSAVVTHAGYLTQTNVEASKHLRPEAIFELSQVLIGSFYGQFSGKFAEATLILSQVYAQGTRKDLAVKFGEQASKLFKDRCGADHEQTKLAIQFTEAINKSIEAQIKGDEEKSARLAKRLGLDPKRAATLRARFTASSSHPNQVNGRHQETIKSDLKVPSSSKPIASTSKISYSLKKNNGTATIDELVRYIQGSGSPTKPTKVPIRTRAR